MELNNGRIQAVSQPQGLNNMPNVPPEASQNKRLLSLRPEEMFQTILPKVDHILSLLQEQQEQMMKANSRVSDAMEVEGQPNGVQAGNQEVDLEDKIYKEASAIRLLLNSQKNAAYELPGGHLSIRQVEEGTKLMDKEIHRNKLILDRFEDRLSRASLINSSNLSNDRQRKEAYTADV